ncbi:MAG TPA: NADH-quinone oxidoreductase subunit C [Actinomycetota bacterium]|nr:NADH-quinone oxidoreductase subunit C [Actinomycetota bacterium]
MAGPKVGRGVALPEKRSGPSARPRAIGADEALARVRQALGDRADRIDLNFGQIDLTCKPDQLVQVMTALAETPGLECKFLTFLSAIDWSEFGGGEEEKAADEQDAGRRGLEVLVHVYSPDYVVHCNVHVPVDPEHPACPSITSIYPGANWHERETHEMFGVVFEGHPRLVNLYLPEDFEGRPLLKSFRLSTRVVKDWPGAKDPEEAAAGGR